MDRYAVTEVPIHELIARRWSPTGFDASPLARGDLAALLEAARWAASAFNEQPWRFLVATRDEPEAFATLLSCLVEGNQAWATNASALLLGVVSLRFAHNGKPNLHARHDLGLATAGLTVEAGARGLHVHPMAGIQPARAREIYGIPEDFEPVTAVAVGRPVRDPSALPEDLRRRDTAPRRRRPLAETAFQGDWGKPALRD